MTRSEKTGVYVLPEEGAVYNYRYFLPYWPEWGSREFCEGRLNELLRFCRDAKVDSVQFYVNILPGTYYMPAHGAEEQSKWAEWMCDIVAPAVRGAGISYQLNFQLILGAAPYKLDMRDEYDWEFLVDQHGNESSCACPIGPRFRENMGAMLRLWASTRPDIIWIDDDLRLHNHGLAAGEPDYYCFCQNHLDAFARYSGRRFTREELISEILKPGAPSETRRRWMDFLGESMTETAGWIRGQVHSVSPNTRLAQMTSAPDVHSAEGRNWKEFLTALCGDYAPITRPCNGVYTGTSFPVRHHTITYRMMHQSMAVLEDTLGPGAVDFGPELENTRFTTWSKSAANTKYAIILSQLLGAREITLSINDLDGSPIDEEPSNMSLLKDTKPLLNTIAGLGLRRWHGEGVVFLNDPKSAGKVRLAENALYSDLVLAREWEDITLQLGIPACYLSCQDASEPGHVVALDRSTAWLPSDEELLHMLSGAVLLDGGAADILRERGFEKYTGVSIGGRQNYGVTSESYAGDVLPGVHACRVPHRGMDWYEMALSGAVQASEFIDSKNRRHLGSAIFENSIGGRVAVYASEGDLSPYGTFGSHARLRWMHGMLRWLSREAFPVLSNIPHHALTVARTDGNRRLIALANLGTDPLPEITFRLGLPSAVSSVNVIDDRGVWQSVPCKCERADVPGTYLLTLGCDLSVFEWLIMVLD